MLTARATGQSARFCGEQYHSQHREDHGEDSFQQLPFPHPPHPLSGGVANRLLCNSALPASASQLRPVHYTWRTAFCQILLLSPAPPMRGCGGFYDTIKRSI